MKLGLPCWQTQGAICLGRHSCMWECETLRGAGKAQEAGTCAPAPRCCARYAPAIVCAVRDWALGIVFATVATQVGAQVTGCPPTLPALARLQLACGQPAGKWSNLHILALARQTPGCCPHVWTPANAGLLGVERGGPGNGG